jgi:hypothetical protein
MSTTPNEPVRDEDIETVGAPPGAGEMIGHQDADGTDSGDADGTDSGDADGTDSGDADGTDSGDADGTDA